MAGEIGKVIKRLREAARLRQADLSRACNVKQPNLSRIEKGHCDPRRATLERIAEALGTTVADIEAEAAKRAAAASWSASGRGNGGAPTAPVPVFDTSQGYGIEFDDSGLPAASPMMVVQVPLQEAPCFGCRVHGEAMLWRGEGFETGEIVIFVRKRPARGDYAFVRTAAGCVFKQVFPEESTVRLVPVNRAHQEQRVAAKDVVDMWKLVMHLRTFR